ncbi:uncharacterized protein LOC113790888 [Dermatophagoides pteronyssinus]|uniref:uncharacterized protein LOC113790888 n=1 Tax=Dermatophagoides pteronyssinus TaxID=6956 RepID=UPI003F66E320
MFQRCFPLLLLVESILVCPKLKKKKKIMKFLSLLTIVTMFCLTFVYSGTDKLLDSEKVIEESKNLIKKTENLRTTIAEMPYQQHKELGDQANVLRYWLLKARTPTRYKKDFDKIIQELDKQNEHMQRILKKYGH